MIGVVDIGNTRTKCAMYGAKGELVKESVFPSGPGLPMGATEFFGASVDRAVVGSVVPSATPIWAEYLLSVSGMVHVAGHDSPWGFHIGVEEPAKVGIDRLANMEGALQLPGNVLVVDAGTATKFDLLEGVSQRFFPGGAIAPGLEISYEALIGRTAQLPKIELAKHSPVLGYNTETAIRSGVVHGFASMVDGMVMRFFEERKLPAGTQVVATGGNSSYLMGRARLISLTRPRLTLEGLYGLAKKL